MKFAKSEQQKLKNFHGHLGPYILLGYKIGQLAIAKLRTKNKELRTDYFGPAKTPYTCLVDGLQIVTGCTYGKRNIKVYNKSGLPRIVFKTAKRKLVVNLKQELTSTKQIYNSKLEELIWIK